MGVPEQILVSINKLQYYERKKVTQNIVITGGSSLIYDFLYKAKEELDRNIPSSLPYNLFYRTENESNAFKGLCALVNSTQNKQNFITKQEYEEQGPRVYLSKEIK